MKIANRIFIVTYIIIMLSLGIGGFILVNSMFSQDMGLAVSTAEDSNNYLYTSITTMTDISDENYVEYYFNSLKKRVMGESHNNKVVIGKYKEIYQDTQVDLNQISDKEIKSYFFINREKPCIQIISKAGQWYIINNYDISDIYDRRNDNYGIYCRIIVIAAALMSFVLYVVSWYISKPIKELTNAAYTISKGDYSVRVDTRQKKMKSYEVKKLGEAINQMTINTQEYISQIEEVSNRREVFIADFTHEIKTPLTSIIGYSDMLRTFNLEPEKVRDYGEFIYKEGKRLENLSLNLLKLIVMKNTDFEKETVEVGTLFGDIENATAFLGKKYGVKIDITGCRGCVSVETDLIKTMIINLLDNGCKASEKGGKVELTAEECGDNIVISVIDKGIGIKESQIDKITEPFYMVDKSRARKQGGAGLGLALCREIAGVHHTDLHIESEYGKGTCVSFELKKVMKEIKEECTDEE